MIVLDITPALTQRAGIARYTRNLSLALLDALPADRVALVTPRHPSARLTACFPSLSSSSSSPSSFLSSLSSPPVSLSSPPVSPTSLQNKAHRAAMYALRRVGGSLAPLLGRPALFHAFDFLYPPLGRTPTICTVHDLSAIDLPETHSRGNRVYSRFALPALLRDATVIVAVSRFTRQRLEEAYAVPPERVRVIANGVEARFHPAEPAVIAAVRARHRLPSAYVLALGTLEPRKNLRRLFAAMDMLAERGVDIPLVIAGGGGWGDALDAGLARTAFIQMLGYVPDDDLPALLGGASALAYPSLYEGFGLPVLEAMACGAPVVAGDTPALREIGEGVALFADPRGVESIAHAVEQALSGAVTPTMLAEGRRRASAYSWTAAADGVIALYRELGVLAPA